MGVDGCIRDVPRAGNGSRDNAPNAARAIREMDARDRAEISSPRGEIMTRDCPICDYPLIDGDDVVAIVVAKFKMLESAVSYAIDHPTRCIELVHEECFDYDEYEDDEPEAA